MVWSARKASISIQRRKKVVGERARSHMSLHQHKTIENVENSLCEYLSLIRKLISICEKCCLLFTNKIYSLSARDDVNINDDRVSYFPFFLFACLSYPQIFCYWCESYFPITLNSKHSTFIVYSRVHITWLHHVLNVSFVAEKRLKQQVT